MNSTTGISDAKVSSGGSNNGFAKNASTLVTLDITNGYSIDDPDSFVSGLVETAWSVNDKKPSDSVSILVTGSSVDLTSAADKIGASVSVIKGQIAILEPVAAAEKHFGSWPGTAPASIDGISPQ